MRARLEQAAQEVFDELGPGWSESIYHKALIRELSERQIPHYTEGSLSVMYKGGSVGTRRPDLLVHMENGDAIIVELKVDTTRGKQQLQQYLNMAEQSNDLGSIRGGALISFNDELRFEFIELGPEPNPDDMMSARGLYRWERDAGWKKDDELPNFEEGDPITIDPFSKLTVEDATVLGPVYGTFVEYVTDDLAKVYIPPAEEDSDWKTWFVEGEGEYILHEGYLTPQ